MTYALLVFEMGRFWIAPDIDNTDRLQTLTVMMAFEFIMVHSGVFMAATPKRLALILLVPFYGLFAWAMNSMTPGNTILWIYFGVVFLRMRFAFSDTNGPEKDAAMLMSIFAAMLYFALIFAVALTQNLIPKFGLTDNFLIESGYRANVTATGIFVELPHIPLAMGVVYFSLLAVIEARIFGLFKASPQHVD